jgi:hypothetical protein
MLTETIRITAAFGSEMQRDVAMKILRQILTAWESDTRERHQKNRISIVYGSHEPAGDAAPAK